MRTRRRCLLRRAGLALALGCVVAGPFSCSRSGANAGSGGTTAGTVAVPASGSTAPAALVETVRESASAAGIVIGDTETRCMDGFLAGHPGLGAKTAPESRDDSRAAYEMIVRCLGKARTAAFLVGSGTGADPALGVCVGRFFDTIADDVLVDGLTTAQDTPPGTLMKAAEEKCPNAVPPEAVDPSGPAGAGPPPSAVAR